MSSPNNEPNTNSELSLKGRIVEIGIIVGTFLVAQYVANRTGINILPSNGPNP